MENPHTRRRADWPLSWSETAPASGPVGYSAGDLVDGKYRLERVLGEGGMGTVWLARNLTLDSDVAIKLLRRRRVTTETRERLHQEARASARLEHPSIVRTFDFGWTRRGDPYVVMEVLRGESLADVLDREGRLIPVHAVSVLLPIAGALATAHQKGVVHRDLKPENVLLVPHETGTLTPKLMDFGIAKLVDPDDADEGRRLTGERTILGTPDYMSPEQACGDHDVDARSDVWSYCVMLHELLEGRRPFEGDGPRALFRAIVDAEPGPLGPHVDARLREIVARGLAKEREDRWSSMRELGVELAQWLVDRGVDYDVAGTSIAVQWLGAPVMVATDVSFASTTTRPILVPSSTASTPPIPLVVPARRRLRLAAVAAFALVAVAAVVVRGPSALGVRGVAAPAPAPAPERAAPRPAVATPMGIASVSAPPMSTTAPTRRLPSPRTTAPRRGKSAIF